ncbi:MAG: hypothetical protein KF862_06475 [Chitinophagaceae bacterium]|nr:hypothetical protein [Chitinophagaceae bacterium]
MKKYQVTIKFNMDDDFMALIPKHREYINSLIESNAIDQYVVTMESQKIWITVSAENKKQVKKYLSGSPIYKYWKFEIEELVVVDGQLHRLPAVQLN